MDHYETAVQNQLAAAKALLDQALAAARADPGHLAGLFGHLGQLYLLYDFMAPAATALGNAQNLVRDDPRWPYFLAIHHLYVGDLEEAVQALDRVLELEPRDLAARTRRANTLFELGDLDQAERDYGRILEVDPAHSAALFGLGRIDFERGNPEQAISWFEAALERQPSGSAINHHLGMALRRLGRREEAAARLQSNQHIRVAFRDPLFQALQRLNTSREAHFKAGTDAMRAGDAETALRAFGAALDALPDDTTTLFNIGMALIELGDKEGAEARLRRAIELDDGYREPHYNLAMILTERGDLAGAERHFARTAEIDPDDLEARVRRADVLTRLGRPSEAIPLLRQVLAIDAAMPIAQLALAVALQSTGDTPAARHSLHTVLKAAPGAPRERAEAHYRLAVLAETNRAPGSTGGGTANGAHPPAGDRRDAAEHLRRAIELDPDLAEAHAFLGRLLARDERYAEAASHFGRALARDPANGEWHRDRAMALILGRRYAAARGGLSSARRALTGASGHPVGATDHLDTLLARLLAASPDPSVRDGAEALAIAKRLMSERPSLEHAETVAMALAETGDFDGAAALQRQVLDEVRRRGGTPTAGQSQRLATYLNSEPAREPWFSP